MDIDNLTTNGTQSIVRGLQILAALIDSDRPMTATELAGRVGLHQSTASRILSTFQAIGFVRKPDYHHFAPDLGLALFAGRMAKQYPMIRRALPVLQRRVEEYAGFGVTLCSLWRQELLILVKRDPHGEFLAMPANRSPLHLSAAGLRHLLEMSEREALAHLKHSRDEFGWQRPTKNVPATAKATLAAARKACKGDVLTLTDWAGPDEQKAAVPIRQDGQVVATLVLYASIAPARLEDGLDLLEDLARDVEESLAATDTADAAPTPKGMHL